jgi:hypothetical protein
MDYYYLRLACRRLLSLVAVIVGTTLAFSGLSQGGIYQQLSPFHQR